MSVTPRWKMTPPWKLVVNPSSEIGGNPSGELEVSATDKGEENEHERVSDPRLGKAGGYQQT